jgi:hypothetical protein
VFLEVSHGCNLVTDYWCCGTFTCTYAIVKLLTSCVCLCGPGSVVGIAAGYRLDGPGIKSRWRVRFSTPVQTGPGAHPASCTMGTGSFPGVNSGWGVTLTPHPLLVAWSRKSRAIPLLPLWPIWPVQSLSACIGVHFTFFLCVFVVIRLYACIIQFCIACGLYNFSREPETSMT